MATDNPANCSPRVMTGSFNWERRSVWFRDTAGFSITFLILIRPSSHLVSRPVGAVLRLFLTGSPPDVRVWGTFLRRRQSNPLFPCRWGWLNHVRGRKTGAQFACLRFPGAYFTR